ncbi:MAG: polymer-forming cytoskeletal protein, partial [Chloroflexi bacterium]|nr:polymer-forming cytoskeletal protein [Chloroflexota bacterium]
MRSPQIKFFFAIMLIVLLVSGCSPGFESDGTPYYETFPGQFLVGDVYVLQKGQRIDGDIAGVGITLVIEHGAFVMGDISLIGSTLEIHGRVAGDLNIIAGSSAIRETAVIDGDVNQIFTTANINPGARVSGEINTFVIPTPRGASEGGEILNTLSWLHPRHVLLFKLGQVLAMMLVSLLIISFFTEPTLKVSRSIRC